MLCAPAHSTPAGWHGCFGFRSTDSVPAAFALSTFCCLHRVVSMLSTPCQTRFPARRNRFAAVFRFTIQVPLRRVPSSG